MSAILPQHNLAYISVPKCACTSIKELIFCLENNCRFNKARDQKGALCLIINNKPHYIHEFYPSIAFSQQPHKQMQSLHRICIVRDPVDRIISCYHNRVLRYGALSEDSLSEANISAPANPDLNQFIQNLSQYKSIGDIQHHTLPLIHFLGSESDFYDEIFNLRTLEQAERSIKRHFGQSKIALPHLQRTEQVIKKHSSAKPSTLSTRIIQNLYEEDYKAYAKYF